MVNDNRFYTALSLKKHPILNQKKRHRERYVKALFYFVYKYSKDDIYAEYLFKRYRDELGTSCENIKAERYSDIKRLCSGKLKTFDLLSYRKEFIYDCLFINAFGKPELAEEIIKELKTIFDLKYHVEIDELYRCLYDDKTVKLYKYQTQNWFLNRDFIKSKADNILITANMSAGKSTLINSIFGMKVSETRSDACTNSINYFYNKPFQDNVITKSINGAFYYTDISEHSDCKGDNVHCSTYMETNSSECRKICIIDTPGVNSFLNKEHYDITLDALDSLDYSKLIYVINANNIGASDDAEYLKVILEKSRGRKVIFVLNKIDTFRLSEDSIETSINDLKKYLINMGFKDIILCPISAYAAMLFKKLLNGYKLTEDEEFECGMLLRKFSREEYNLSKYYLNECKAAVNSSVSFERYDAEHITRCLYNTGMINLENLIINN